MIKSYDFPTSAKSMLNSSREHIEELLKSTDFLDPSHGHNRIAHFALLDDLLMYLCFLENGSWPTEGYNYLPRSSELGPGNFPAFLQSIKK